MPATNTESLLNAAMAKYRNPEMTKRDVLTVLHHYRGLIPKQDKFIFNDGVHRDLLNIYGTIPVPYKGQNYNIPVSLWLLDTHPFNAPICYVKPTPDMQIKVSKYVDQSGKIYLPYLHDWSHPNSELLGLVQICIAIFSEQPPVYAKPKQEPGQGVAVGGVGLPYPLQQGQPGAGYPGGRYPPPVSGGPPGYPAYMQGGQHFPAYSQSPAPSQAFNQPGYFPSQSTSSYQIQTGPGFYSQANFNSTSSVSADAGSSSSGTGTVTQEHLKASIVSAVEDKVKAHLREEFSMKQAETDTLKHTGKELGEGRQKLQQMVSQLSVETQEMEARLTVLAEKKTQMEKVNLRLEEQGEVDCDQAVVATAPVFNQLFEDYSEEAAIEDAVYFLGEALRRGVIDCETFLKHVRNLSRKQFLLRARMLKCRKIAGLSRQ